MNATVLDFCHALAVETVGETWPASPGVYVILNAATMRVYVGQTGNVRARLGNHRAALRSGQHRNERLQTEWTLHGEAAFRLAPFALVADRASAVALEHETIASIFGDRCFNYHDRVCGRASLPAGERAEVGSVRFTKSQWQMVKSLGGARWIAKWLDAQPDEVQI